MQKFKHKENGTVFEVSETTIPNIEFLEAHPDFERVEEPKAPAKKTTGSRTRKAE